MLAPKKGSKYLYSTTTQLYLNRISRKKEGARKKKDSLDDDDLFQNLSSMAQQASSNDGMPELKRKSSKIKRLSAEKIKPPKKEPSVMNQVKKNSNSRKSKKVMKVDPALCAAVKKFEEAVRGMVSNGGITRYFESRLQSYVPQGLTTNVSAANASKNRDNHQCYDHSRVKLEMDGTRKNDYINASHVRFNDVHRKYILTQYPLPDALEDFWSMIFSNEVETILSVFNPHGDKDIKEFQHRASSHSKNSSEKRSSQMRTCPSSAESTKPLSMRENTFNMSKSQYEIAATSKRCVLADSTSYFPLNEGQYMTIGKYFIHTRKVEVPEKYERSTIYTIEVLPEGCSECRFVRVVNFPKWGAKSTPNIKVVLYLLRSISLDPLQKGPVVVHCDNGINRAATLVLTDVISNRVLEGKTIDIDEIFKQIRNQRCGSFQTAFYFTYAIYSAASYIYLRCKTRGAANAETTLTMRHLVRELAKFNLPSREDATT